jgi:hypothetical protein
MRSRALSSHFGETAVNAMRVARTARLSVVVVGSLSSLAIVSGLACNAGRHESCLARTCRAGLECVSTGPHPKWLAPRVCETLCSSDADCPSGFHCDVLVMDAPRTCREGDGGSP